MKVNFGQMIFAKVVIRQAVGYQVHIARLKYKKLLLFGGFCMDAQIACAGYYGYIKGETAGMDLNAIASLPL